MASFLLLLDIPFPCESDNRQYYNTALDIWDTCTLDFAQNSEHKLELVAVALARGGALLDVACRDEIRNYSAPVLVDAFFVL